MMMSVCVEGGEDKDVEMVKEVAGKIFLYRKFCTLKTHWVVLTEWVWKLNLDENISECGNSRRIQLLKGKKKYEPWYLKRKCVCVRH